MLSPLRPPLSLPFDFFLPLASGMRAAYGPVVPHRSGVPLAGASFVRFRVDRLTSRASSGCGSPRRPRQRRRPSRRSPLGAADTLVFLAVRGGGSGVC